MLDFLRKMRGKLDRSKNPVWGKRASMAYAFGVWTVLGLFFVKWRLDSLEPKLPVPGLDSAAELTVEEKRELRRAKLAEQKIRTEEISNHVAENVYTPVDFMA